MNLIVNNGWLNVYKPPNITSSKTVLKIKKQFKLKKIGHAGTLDPNAEGILPIAFGSTTRIISFMENKLEWHHGSLNEELYNKAIRELEIYAN